MPATSRRAASPAPSTSARRISVSLPVMRERACSYSMRYASRASATAISVITGCSASTARGISRSPSSMTDAPLSAPATAHAIASRFTSPKPEKRQMPLGTPKMRNSAA
ncbi:MAG: hypothetical protein LKCHEGNO_01758 [Burkholderiaceae bacterium]|nr:hypothetical protein [Burkholderiaceae bacterium]